MTTEENSTAITKAMPQVAMTNRGFQPTDIDQAYRMATWMSQSDIVPERYQGEPGKCMIAYDLSLRLGVSYLMVMQHVYSVHGRPSMEAVLVTALINRSGLYTDSLEYEEEGEDPYKAPFRVRAVAVSKSTGKKLEGPWISWELVKAEGWEKPKKGFPSKWMTMPDQMFHYRAASWFQRRFCPEVSMGMLTAEEAHEIPPPKHVDSVATYSDAKQQAEVENAAETGSKETTVTDPEETEEELQARVEAEAKEAAQKKAAAKNMRVFICPACKREYRYGKKEGVGVPCECGKASIILKTEFDKKEAEVKAKKDAIAKAKAEAEADIQAGAAGTSNTGKLRYTCNICKDKDNPKVKFTFAEPGKVGNDDSPSCPQCFSRNFTDSQAFEGAK